MKGTSLFVGLCCYSLVIAIAEDQRMYTTKYDDIDIDAVIRNERLLNNYVGCLLDKKPCTPDAAELKVNLPDALANNCSLCSDTQKKLSDKLSHYLIDHRPADWTLLEDKYDPTGDYRARYLHSREMDSVEDVSSMMDSDKDKDD